MKEKLAFRFPFRGNSTREEKEDAMPIIGNPGFAKYRDEIIRQRIEEQRALREGRGKPADAIEVGGVPIQWKLAVLALMASSIANCYLFHNESVINRKVDEMQDIEQRLLLNEVRDLRQFLVNVNKRIGEK